MGTYLSTPVTDKGIEENEDLSMSPPMAWGVVDMQGWRKTMEDAHIAQVDVTAPQAANVTNDAKVFAVFDGHGGAEVARLCQLYLVDVLTHQDMWCGENMDVGEALIGSFHAMDRLVDSSDRREELESLKSEKPNPDERRTVDGSKLTTTGSDGNGNTEEMETGAGDDDSDEVVGEIAEDRLDDSTDSSLEGETVTKSEEAVSLFKKLLSINQESNAAAAANTSEGGDNVHDMVPTKILNGRQICNLPDHPIHAGCTAVCAVIVGDTLTVANAGDSRVVLCREGGSTEAMSFDHKPMHETEMNRITAAGGFVNQFGRVNGNLNLSRSIGDMKYKQVPGIDPPGQMITAQPDIKSVTLSPNDEFIILACDGIWDCLTNEEAVKFILDRIDTKTPAEIGTEMLDEIISIDPRETQGIGGDNMTVMIVDLLPATRSHRKD